ncbi:MAG: uracil-DNA glycosylase family protein [Pseudomonadota bacterium]
MAKSSTSRRQGDQGPTRADVVSVSDAIRSCRLCIEAPDRTPLPHEPKPIFRLSSSARIAVCSQAPGVRAHTSGVPFLDPSGVRLRAWMAVSEAEFYDDTRVAIVPMGFCFPGLDAKGGDLPPRRECARTWRDRALSTLGDLDLLVLVGSYAQRWHLGGDADATLTETVRNWRRFAFRNEAPRIFVLPHPSWRNNAWLKANPWFEAETLPELRAAVRSAIEQPVVART